MGGPIAFRTLITLVRVPEQWVRNYSFVAMYARRGKDGEMAAVDVRDETGADRPTGGGHRAPAPAYSTASVCADRDIGLRKPQRRRATTKEDVGRTFAHALVAWYR
jgi:hypothetical protein